MCSPLIEVLFYLDSAQCVRMSSNTCPPSGPSFLLIGSFSPLINSVSAGWPEPSWDKHSTIDQYLKRLTYPSVYISSTKGHGVITSVHPLCCWKIFLSFDFFDSIICLCQIINCAYNQNLYSVQGFQNSFMANII